VEIAQPAISGPVVLAIGEQRVDLPVGGYSPALSIRVEDGAMVPYLDPELLAEPLTNETTGVGEKAVDASIDIVNGAPVITPGKPGVGLQPEEMATALLPALTQTGEARSVAVEATAVEPLFTTADAEALQVKEKVGEFTTNFPHAEYRNINQSRAAALIDGYLVKPGETFSFNDTVGERTRANGFTDGFVINGGVFKEELGGGVSQTVTTLYNAAFFAGMDDVEHHPHAFYIDRYPVGREATVYYGSLDLRFKNSTEYGVLIKANVARSAPGRAGAMHVELWSTKVYDVEAGASSRRNFRSPGLRYDESPSCVPQSPIGGFDIDIYRIFKQNGQVVKQETDTAVYSAADTVVCGPRPAPPPPA
jgi:vancomycin resistance protein YoaR